MDNQIDSHGRAYPGLFIAVIGGDGVGKSSLLQSAKLYLALRASGRIVENQHVAPTWEPLGKLARYWMPQAKYALDHQIVALTMTADRLWQWDNHIRPGLDAGNIVLCDRWSACSGAYQGVYPELHRYILSINQPVPHPDYTVYLRMDDVEELAHRAGCGVDNEHATVERLTAIQQRYEANAVHWQRNHNAFLSVTVDGMTPTEVAERVASAIVTRFPDVFYAT